MAVWGAVLRYGVSAAAMRMWGPAFPAGTLIVNVTGCFLLGLLRRWTFAQESLSPEIQAGLTVGLLGALTTFSTFGYETIEHLDRSQYSAAVLNISGNLVIGLLAVWAGMALGKMISG